MSERYYIAENRELLRQGKALLTGSEAVHLIRVMRVKAGEELTLFAGDGIDYTGRVVRTGRDEIELEILTSRRDEKEPVLDLTMAAALPKGDRQKWLIEKLTELGVRRYIPLAVDRADIKVDDAVLNRLRRQVIEASKQSGRSRLMEILPEMSRRTIAEQFPFADNDAGRRSETVVDGKPLMILCHPISDGFFGQISFLDLLSRLSAEGKIQVPKKILLVIGPVGGFSDREVQEAVDDGWPILDLGRQVYRVETAAVCAASLLLHLEK